MPYYASIESIAAISNRSAFALLSMAAAQRDRLVLKLELVRSNDGQTDAQYWLAHP